MKHIILLLITLLTLSTPLAAMANTMDAEIAEVGEAQTIKIEQRAGVLIITGAAGKTLQVFDMVGLEVLNVRIDSNEKRVDISQLRKGIYPVKVGNVTKKIYVRGR